jgi:hypothetical protein
MNSRERSRERAGERKRMMIRNVYYVKRRYKIKAAGRIKTGVEPIWFDIMPCASFNSVLRSTS